MANLNRDVFGGIALVAVGILGLLASFRIDAAVTVDPLGPQLYPQVLLALLLALGVLLIASGLRRRAPAVQGGDDPGEAPVGETAAEPEPGSAALRPVGVLLLGVVYIVILAPLGYLISTFALLAAFLAIMGIRSSWRVAVVSGLATAVLYAFFDLLLAVPLPTGVLG